MIITLILIPVLKTALWTFNFHFIIAQQDSAIVIIMDGQRRNHNRNRPKRSPERISLVKQLYSSALLSSSCTEVPCTSFTNMQVVFSFLYLD